MLSKPLNHWSQWWPEKNINHSIALKNWLSLWSSSSSWKISDWMFCNQFSRTGKKFYHYHFHNTSRQEDDVGKVSLAHKMDRASSWDHFHESLHWSESHFPTWNHCLALPVSWWSVSGSFWQQQHWGLAAVVKLEVTVGRPRHDSLAGSQLWQLKQLPPLWHPQQLHMRAAAAAAAVTVARRIFGRSHFAGRGYADVLGYRCDGSTSVEQYIITLGCSCP